MNTHIHIHTHIHTKTHACTRACARVHTHTHTKCSFVIGGQSLWNHLPDTVKEVGSIELFKQILKTVVFSQSLEIPVFLICNSALDFIRFICSRKFLTSSYNTPVSTCAMYGTLWEVTKFTFDYLSKNKPSFHFTRCAIIARILNRWSSSNVLITINRRRTQHRAWSLRFHGGDISCKRIQDNEIKIK